MQILGRSEVAQRPHPKRLWDGRPAFPLSSLVQEEDAEAVHLDMPTGCQTQTRTCSRTSKGFPPCPWVWLRQHTLSQTRQGNRVCSFGRTVPLGRAESAI